MKHIIESYLSDYLVIKFYPLTICNYNCSYCYVKDKSKKYNEKYINDFINFLKIQKYPIDLTILGGEPLLVKNIENLITKLCDICKNVTLVTNGKYLNNFNIDERCSVEVSLHYEYINEEYIKNLESIKRKYTLVINICKDFDLNKIINSVKNINQRKVLNPLYINQKFDVLNVDKIEKDLGILEDYHIKLYKIDNKNITLNELIDFGNNRNFHFKNCVCQPNCYKIYPDKPIMRTCDDFIIGDLNTIIDIKPIICKQETCFLDCNIHQRKIFLK